MKIRWLGRLKRGKKWKYATFIIAVSKESIYRTWKYRIMGILYKVMVIQVARLHLIALIPG